MKRIKMIMEVVLIASMISGCVKETLTVDENVESVAVIEETEETK